MPAFLRAKRSRSRERGSTAIEFALVAIAAIPLLFGLIAFGITLGRGIQAVQVTRDVGHMFAQGADFSQTNALNIVSKLAQDFDLNASTGSAVLILSKVQKISPSDCGLAPTVGCNNIAIPVFTYRKVIGNSSLRASAFGTPPPAYISANGEISASNYLQYSSLRATNFENVLTLVSGEYTSMVEGFFRQPDLNFLQPGIANANQGTYVRVLF